LNKNDRILKTQNRLDSENGFWKLVVQFVFNLQKKKIEPRRFSCGMTLIP